MDIQQLHMENNAYRDMINNLKRQIVDFDKHIQANEIEIGRQLSDMQSWEHKDCTLCMGDCDAEIK